MGYFTSDPTNTTETVTIVQDYLGGTYNNYLKPIFKMESVISVKQSGSDMAYTLEDIDGDGKLEVMVGEATGVFSLTYMIPNVADAYRETIEATTYSDGQQNNYFLTTNFPITTLNSPATGVVEGDYKNVVRVGNMSGRVAVDYDYDNGEINTIASQIKKIQDENADLRTATANQYVTIEDAQKDLNIANKYNGLYNRAYDFEQNIPLEVTYADNETSQIGTWTYVTSASTYYYLEGNSSGFATTLTNEIPVYQEEISTYSLLGNYYETRETNSSATSTPSGHKDYFEADHMVDGLTTEPYSFQSNDVNPITVNIELPSAKYITKIRVNATPNEETEVITTVTLCDSVSGLDNPVSIFDGERIVSNQFTEFYCQQDFDTTDDNGNSLVYLPKKKVVQVTLSRPKKTSVWVSEIEVFYANYNNEDLNFLDETWAMYNQVLATQSRTFGANAGWDTFPATGRATWWSARNTSLLNRIANNQTFLDVFFNQDITTQVDSEGDTAYTVYQKNLWRLKYEDQKKKYDALNESLNTNATTIVTNSQQLVDLERYI